MLFALPLAFNFLRHCENNPKSIALMVSPLIAPMKDHTAEGREVYMVEMLTKRLIPRSTMGSFSWCFRSPEAVLTKPKYATVTCLPREFGGICC